MQGLIKNINYIWNKFKKTNKEFWYEIEEQLILNDVSVDTTEFIINKIKDTALKENINDLVSIKNLIKSEISKILSSDLSKDKQSNIKLLNINNINSENTNSELIKEPYGQSYFSDIPKIWMMVGVNGVGKTSTIAKLANYFKKLNKSVLLTAADTFRAAAFEQLDHYAKTLNLPIVHHQRYSDPGAVVYDSIEKALAKKIELILIDTAGRMHTDYNLMEELKKIKKVIFKKQNKDPDEILMVIDSTTGQNAKNQVKIFNEALGLTGLILSKTDGTAKGGVIITLKYEFGIPIKFITYGEQLDNIEIFKPEKFSERLIS